MQVITNNITIATSKIQQALSDWKGEPPVQVGPGSTQTINLCSLPVAFLRALMSTDLTKGQRALIAGMVGDKANLAKEMVASPHALSKVLKIIFQPNEPVLEMMLNGRWYPVPMGDPRYNNDPFWGSSVSFDFNYWICDFSCQSHVGWRDSDFVKDGERSPRTVGDLLATQGFRISSAEAIESYREKEERADRIRGRAGKVVNVKNSVLAPSPFLYGGGLQVVNLGSEDLPRQAIMERDLEVTGNRGGFYYRGQTEHNLPFVRVFSTDLKQYVYADVDDLEDYSFDKDALTKLVLPNNMRKMVGKIFDTPCHKIFGDLARGRHGGMVILANGTQGVGKTLTAEVFAEHTHRPLYVLEMGELGTNLAEVEKSLQRVFARATRWNAVLLFDEADVFLSKRQESDLERSAIVGVFLRLLDRYEGLFFLTTNRAEVIDPAFKSRITLKLDYPELDLGARKQIWQKMLSAAGFRQDDLDMDRVAEAPIDGRKIRNQVRLLRTLIDGTDITADQILETLEFVAK